MANFDLSRTGILRSAYQLCGIVMAGSDPSAPQLTMGSDFLNVILQDMQNAGIMLRKLERTTIPLVYGQAQYTLAADTLDVDIGTPYVTSTGGVDLEMRPISRAMYMEITNKNPSNPTISQPTQIYLEKTEVMSVFLFPAPDANWVSFTIPRVVLLANMDSAADTTGLQAKYLKTIVFGVSHMLAYSHGLLQKAKMFKEEFEGLLKLSTGDDDEHGDVRFIVDNGNGGGW
jgi:hypothetical protein